MVTFKIRDNYILDQSEMLVNACSLLYAVHSKVVAGIYLFNVC